MTGIGVIAGLISAALYVRAPEMASPESGVVTPNVDIHERAPEGEIKSDQEPISREERDRARVMGQDPPSRVELSRKPKSEIERRALEQSNEEYSRRRSEEFAAQVRIEREKIEQSRKQEKKMDERWYHAQEAARQTSFPAKYESNRSTSSSASPVWAEEAEAKVKTVAGSVAVTAPNTATLRRSFSVALRVAPGELAPLVNSLAADVPGDRQIRGKSGIEITPKMTASVSGAGFTVTPKDGYTQAAGNSKPTTWTFDVVPIETGELTLVFRLAGSLKIDGTEVPRDFFAYEQDVIVPVARWSFITENMDILKWLATTIVIPLVVFVVKGRAAAAPVKKAWTNFRRRIQAKKGGT